MRLSPKEVAAIKNAAHEAFGETAVVRLFGSRLDDTRRGGDIDLHILSPDEPAPGSRARFRALLDRRVGDREYDILVSIVGQPISGAAARAMAEGQRL